MSSRDIDSDPSYIPVLDKKVFFTSIGTVVAVSLLMILFPNTSTGVANSQAVGAADIQHVGNGYGRQTINGPRCEAPVKYRIHVREFERC